MDDEFGDSEYGYDEECNEPIGSCDERDGDLYEEDCYYAHGERYCGQCYWLMTQ